VQYYDFEVRIAYSETDRMGVIYYANYLVFFERGRTEFLRSLGKRYRDLEEQDGIFLPAADAHVDYLHPGRYDDLIRVRTFLSELGGAHMTFRYEINQVDTGQLIATGSSKHPVVNRLWRPTRIPATLRSLLEPHLEKK
jgi:acyl-CoA thioester hydrolase